MLKRKLLLLIVVLITLKGQSQCTVKLLPEASKKLDTFTFVKNFKVKLKEAKTTKDKKQITLPVMLNKGTKYRFVLKDAKEYEGRLVFELFGDRGRELSSYEPVVKKHYSVLEYSCHHSGMYFLNLEFQGNKEGCGVLVYGFKKLK